MPPQKTPRALSPASKSGGLTPRSGASSGGLTPRGGASSPRGPPPAGSACKSARGSSPAKNGSSSNGSSTARGPSQAADIFGGGSRQPVLKGRTAAVPSPTLADGSSSGGGGASTARVRIDPVARERMIDPSGEGGGGGSSSSDAAATGADPSSGRGPLSGQRPGLPELELPRPMVAAKALVVRTGFELSTPKLAEMAAGTPVELLEMRQLPDYTARALIAIRNGPRGWVSMWSPKDRIMQLVELSGGGVTSGRQGSGREGAANGGAAPNSGGRENASPGRPGAKGGLAGGAHGGASKGEPSTVAGPAAPRMPTYMISSPKPLLARTEFDLQSGRVGDLEPGTRVHVLESRPLPDGGRRVRLSLEVNPSVTYGWVTAITKSGQENLAPYLFEVMTPKPLLVRKEFDLKSEKLGEIAPGTLVFVLEVRAASDGSQRTHFAFATASGGMSAGGWVTSVTKDGAENLAVAARGKAALRSAAGGSAAASGVDASSIQKIMDSAKAGGKAEMAAAAAMLLAKVASKGAKKPSDDDASAAGAAAALEEGKRPTTPRAAKKPSEEGKKPTTPRADGGGGTTPRASGSTTPKSGKGVAQQAQGLSGAEKQKLEEAALQAKREEVKRAVADAANALAKLVSKKPFEEKEFTYKRLEAHRPSGKAEEMPSRHTAVPSCGLVLMFNCYRASFELLQGDLSSLPESEALDLRSLTSGASLGRCKIAPEKGTPFVDRIEFPNEWKMGDEHGLEHNGLQGDGCLLVKIEWKEPKSETHLVPHAALIKCNPWLAYGCAEGARVMIRKATDTQGKCATVQRTLRDDSVVVRVDGTIGESTVDPMPLTVVRTSNPRHEPGTRLLYLHDMNLVDAVVEHWPEKTIDVKEGSRHKLQVQGVAKTGWVTAASSAGEEFLKGPEDGTLTADGTPLPDDGSVMQVKGSKALKVNAECGESAEKAAKAAQTAQLAPRSFVHVHETKTLEDGTKRCCISTIAEQGTVLTAALNEFNHAMQRFKNAAEYEASRVSYCNDIVEREALVEDAITGNLLRIKDQTLHVSTATDVQDNASVPPEWRVDDVRDLVHLMLQPSPSRNNGMHSAQPVLVRAGPGTGKTWMSKQAVYTLADRLRLAGQKGISLVPIVVYVQRVVFLIREGLGGALLERYIESAYAGKKYDLWRKMLVQAYEMRALIVLIDGVDEAAGLRDQIEDFIHGDLVPSGNRILVTSRPEGVTLVRYTGRFVIMNLNELTNEQQRKVISSIAPPCPPWRASAPGMQALTTAPFPLPPTGDQHPDARLRVLRPLALARRGAQAAGRCICEAARVGAGGARDSLLTQSVPQEQGGGGRRALLAQRARR